MSRRLRVVGRIRSALGWATADRREEAKGKLQELGEGAVSHTDYSTTNLLDKAELDVRSDHGDLAPSSEPRNRQTQSPPESG